MAETRDGNMLGTERLAGGAEGGLKGEGGRGYEWRLGVEG